MEVFSNPANVNLYVSGFLWILKLTAVSGFISLVWGTLLAAMRVSPVPVLRGTGALWVGVFRNTPLTLIIFFCYFALYSTMGLTFSDTITINNFWLGVVGLSAYTSAFVCETIRSGVNTIPVGQAEAARAIGMTFMQTLTLIVLPQAARTVVAPLGSILIALCKNTTIVGTIGVLEASSVMKDLINANGNAVIGIFIAFAGTFAIVLVPTGYFFSWLAQRVEVRR
jgi:glutamate transport system permease protein